MILKEVNLGSPGREALGTPKPSAAPLHSQHLVPGRCAAGQVQNNPLGQKQHGGG